ncbi:hypothetical protein AMR41_26210 [Hapalosiphon sp. MRB220]|nr:hypothetical protein AMR41_26210 [Hapalosiphon sp. MRB220]
MAKQVRAVISDNLIPEANAIMAATGITSHSQLVCLLIKNFGNELIQRLKGEISQLAQQKPVDSNDA